jgi:hypothetical protein
VNSKYKNLAKTFGELPVFESVKKQNRKNTKNLNRGVLKMIQVCVCVCVFVCVCMYACL